MGVDKPNYTQVPNLLLDDLMMNMGEAELKVTIALSRLTFGYHRERVEISLSDLQEITHLSRQGVINGINAGLERGTIERTEGKRGGFVYTISINGEQAPTSQRSGLVNEVDQIETSQPNGLPLVNEVDQTSQRSRPELVNEVDQNTPVLKKERKKRIKKELKKDSAIADSPKRDPIEWREFMGAFCWVCFGHMELGTLTKEQLGQVTSEAKKVWDFGHRRDDLKAWYVTVWKKDWRFQKNNEARPEPSEVRSNIAAIRANVPEGFDAAPVGPHANGNGSSKPTALDIFKEHARKNGVAI